jgi:hypothetical protein
MSDKKRNTFFHLIFCSRAPTPPPALVIKLLFLALEKKVLLFFIKQIVIITSVTSHENLPFNSSF